MKNNSPDFNPGFRAQSNLLPPKDTSLFLIHGEEDKKTAGNFGTGI